MTPPPDAAASAAGLRPELRARRQSLPPEYARTASRRIAHRCWQLPELARVPVLAAYLPMRGEVDARWLIRAAWSRGRQVLVPILCGEHLRFAPLHPDSRLLPNRFGIPEPCTPRRALRHPDQLPVVITPLLGFDASCNRLGMGGGYYDRSFAFRSLYRHWNRPQLIGIAFDLQQVERLATQPHDVPLDVVVTESRTLRARTDRLR